MTRAELTAARREAIETAKAEQLDHATKAKADPTTHLARVRAEIRPTVEFQPEEQR